MEKEIDHQSRQLHEANQKIGIMERDMLRMTDIQSWPQLEHVLNENSLIQDIFHEIGPMESQESPSARIQSLITRVIETLSSVTALLFLERKGMEDSAENYERMLQSHEDEVSQILSLWDKTISRGFKKMQRLDVELRELRAGVENQIADRQGQIERESKQLEVLFLNTASIEYFHVDKDHKAGRRGEMRLITTHLIFVIIVVPLQTG